MKIKKPNDPAAIRRPGQLAYDKAAEAAKEKALSAYIALACGHFMTWQDDELWSFQRPAKNKHWCDKCGKWVTKQPRKRSVDLPEEPLF